MKQATTTDLIDVQALRVGMFVHLDGGWMSHPFALNSFRIATASQLATIRSLGLKQVRWSPERSDADGSDDGVARSSTTLPGRLAASSIEAANDIACDDGDAVDTVPHVPGAAVPVDAAARAAGRSRAAVLRQRARERAARQRCERQYAEASRDFLKTMSLVAERPVEARAHAELLTRGLVDGMIGEQELCIRVLGEGAGDKAAMHAVNVSVVSLLMGRCFGFNADDMLDLGVGALLHDVGKAEMPQCLRHREESHSPNEARVYEEHVEIGVTIGQRMGLTAGAAAVIAQHHELADGSGFPARLNSDRMTMAARIVALVNRYDNLCNPHLLARALTPHESLSLLFAQGRSKYDTSILGAFIKMMGVYPPGSAVQLTDDRYALVVSTNSTRPLKPDVLVHDPAVPRAEALVLDLESLPNLGIRRSLKTSQLPPTAVDYLMPAARVAYFFEPAAPAADDDA